MSQEIIAELDKSIKDAKELVELAASLERLNSNRDFKRVILHGYFKEEALRLVMLKADPSMQNQASQTAIITAMDSIGNLHQYLLDLERSGEQAKKAIADAELTREEILAEGDE